MKSGSVLEEKTHNRKRGMGDNSKLQQGQAENEETGKRKCSHNFLSMQLTKTV